MIDLELREPLDQPFDTEEAIARLFEVVRTQHTFLEEVNKGLFLESTVAPAKPREGMLRFADGTSWNPGSGRGLYQYVSGAWVKL